MKIVQCPAAHTYGFDPILFLSGGISGCHEWQLDMIELLSKETCSEELIVINPKRISTTKYDAAKQIAWEYTYMKMADAVAFWFPPETLCPITLYELGRASALGKKIFVGCDPNYQRLFDVRQQLQLCRPEVKVHTNLQDVVNDFIGELSEGNIQTRRNGHI